tara:strand:- start:1022 stop:1279 length:258 start_codon:yes stop_codon:yes gene_type:complete
MLKNLKQAYPNIYILIISIAIVIWFYAITGLVQLITNNSKKLEVYLMLIAVSLSIMYFDDFKFSELYKIDSAKTAAGVTTSLANM